MRAFFFSLLLCSSLAKLGLYIVVSFAAQYRALFLAASLVTIALLSLLLTTIEPMVVSLPMPNNYSTEQRIVVSKNSSEKLIESWEIVRFIQPNSRLLEHNPIAAGE